MRARRRNNDILLGMVIGASLGGRHHHHGILTGLLFLAFLVFCVIALAVTVWPLVLVGVIGWFAVKLLQQKWADDRIQANWDAKARLNRADTLR